MTSSNQTPPPPLVGRRTLLLGAGALLVGCASSSSRAGTVLGTVAPSTSSTGPTLPPATLPPPTIGDLRRPGSTAPDLTRRPSPSRPPGTGAPGTGAPGTIDPDVPATPTTRPAPIERGGATGRPTGLLVLHNSTYLAVLDVATGTERRIEPPDAASPDPGLGVWRGGLVSITVDTGRDGFGIDVYDLGLRRRHRLVYGAELSFVTGAASFDHTGTLVAFSVDELTSDTDDTRIVRTYVLRIADGSVVARYDGVEGPVWTGPRGELIVREAEGDALRVIDPSGDSRPMGVTVGQVFTAYDVSADGRYLVWEDGNDILALDRDTGRRWVAATDRISTVRAPVVSPDGRFLAVLTNVREEDAPHVVPFAEGRTVEIDSAVHALELSFVNVRGRIGWAA